MKKNLFYMIFFFTVLGISTLILNISFKKKLPRVVTCNPFKVISITVENEQTLPIVINKDLNDGRWIVSQGDFSNLADQKTMDIFQNVICYIPYIEKFEPSDPSQNVSKEFGFEKLRKLTARFADKKDPVTLSFGSATPTGTEIYTASSVTPKYIYTIPNTLENQIIPSFMDIQSRHPFDIAEGDTVTFEFQGRRFLSDDIIPVLKAFTWVNYHGPMKEEDLSEYGFFLPDLRIKIEKKNNSQQEFLLTRQNKRYYLTLRMNDYYYVLILSPQAPKLLLDTLEKGITHQTAS
ncbi:MAG: DUF4340 domain-containing protein [Pseudomonadota bacterium]